MRRLQTIASHCAASGSSQSPYDVLQVPRNASAAQIKKAYRKLAIRYRYVVAHTTGSRRTQLRRRSSAAVFLIRLFRLCALFARRLCLLRWHPDKNPDQPELAEKRFKEVGEAYAILSDDKKRATYDRYGYQGLEGHTEGPDNSTRAGTAFSYAGGADPFDLFRQFFGSEGLGGSGGFMPGHGNPSFGSAGGFRMPSFSQKFHQPQPEQLDILPPGTSVRLQGLSTAPQHNGMSAVVAGVHG